MKRFALIFLCLFLFFSLCACDNTTDKSNDNPSVADETISGISDENENAESSGDEIIGTWVCDDINDECYFIFDEKGDAYAKWGTCTVYGYYDFYSDENLYDIDINGFLYNEYATTFKGDKMTLKSDESSFTFEKATMPDISINAPKKLKTDDRIFGDWQSASSYECFRFNDDNTAVITDLMNEATIDCKYTCENETVILYYMSGNTKEGNREYPYSFDGKSLILDDLVYEKVAE